MKPKLAPCGHVGEVIVGDYVQCKTCDPERESTRPEITQTFLFDPDDDDLWSQWKRMDDEG